MSNLVLKNDITWPNQYHSETKIAEDNLWIAMGELAKRLGQIVQNRQVVHTSVFANHDYTQILQKLCTRVIPLLFSENNSSNQSFIHRFHIANNNYSYK